MTIDRFVYNSGIAFTLGALNAPFFLLIVLTKRELALLRFSDFCFLPGRQRVGLPLRLPRQYFGRATSY